MNRSVCARLREAWGCPHTLLLSLCQGLLETRSTMAPTKTPEQTRKLLREAREELEKAQQPLLEQLARCTGPETPWMMAAAGRDDAAVAHAERGAQRAELLERRGDRVAAALGAGWLASARLRRGEFAECLPALLTAMRGLQHVLGPSHAQVGALMAEAAFAKFESCADPCGNSTSSSRRSYGDSDGVGRPKFDFHTGRRGRGRACSGAPPPGGRGT